MNENDAPRAHPIRKLTIGLAVILVACAAVFFAVRTSFFAGGIGRIVSNRFLEGTPFVLTIERIEGSYLQDLTLRGVKVRYTGSEGAFDLFRADEISVRYGVGTLVKRAREIRGFSLTNPVLRLKTDSKGALIVPSFGAGKGEWPSLDIDLFTIENAHVIVQGASKGDALDDLNLAGSIRSRATELRVAIAQGSAEGSGRAFSLRSLKGIVAFIQEPRTPGAAASDVPRIALDSLDVVLDESAFEVSGTIVPSFRQFDLAIEADPINVTEITRILQIETSHYGDFKGSLAARGTVGRFRLDGVVNGVLSGYALSEFAISVFRDGDTIRLDSLRGAVNGARVDGSGSYSLAEPATLDLDLDVRGLDLSRGFVPGTKLPETAVTGAVDLKYRIPDEALSFAVDLDEGDFLGFPFAGGSVRGSYADDTLRLDEILISDSTRTLSARGTVIGDDEVSFMFDIECTANDTIFPYFGIEEYRADAVLNGRWEGTLDEWDLRMSGSCGNLAYHGAFVPVGAVKIAVGKNADYTVQFDIEGPGCRIGPAEFTGLSLSLDFHGTAGTIKRLSLSRDDFRAAVAADIATKGTEATVQFKECTIDALGETWIGGGAFTVVIADTALRFDDIQLHSRAGAAYVDGAIGRASKTARGRFAFERLGLDLLNRGGFRTTPLGGRARGEIRCSGSYTDPDLEIDLTVEGGRIDTFAVDTLRLRADYARGVSVIDSLVIGSPSGSLTLGGRISGMPVREWIKDAGGALKQASVAIESSCRNLDLVPLLSLAGVKGLSGGRLSGAVSITDSLAHPLVSLTGRIDRLSVSSFTIPSVDCDVRVDRDRLSVGGYLNISPAHQGSFHGSVPLEQARFLYSLDRARPVEFALDIPEGDLAVMPGVTDLVADAAGRFSGRLVVSGSIASPHLNGECALRDASFRLSGMEERYEQVNAAVTIADTLITIARFAGREGKKGTVGCSGTISLRGWRPAEYRVSCDLNKFVIASLSDIIASVSGNVRIGTGIEDGRVLPEITGSCRIDESEVSYDLGSFSGSPEAGTIELPSYIAAVDLEIPGNTWIRTPDARVELQGDVTLRHDGKGTYLRGELNLVRGWYNVYGNKFRITSGKLQFVYAGSFRPVVDIEAETKDPEGRSIYLTLQWHQDDLEPRLSLRHQDPGYSETDIWKMLGGGVVVAGGIRRAGTRRAPRRTSPPTTSSACSTPRWKGSRLRSRRAAERGTPPEPWTTATRRSRSGNTFRRGST